MAATEKNVPPRETAGHVLRLPTLPDDDTPGSGFIKRVVGLTLLTMALLVGAGLLVAFTVRMDVTVKTMGVLEPVKIWPVRALESGTIAQVLVQTGDTVQPGTAVLRLDGLELETQLAELRAQRRSTDVDRRRSVSADPLERKEQADRIAQVSARLVTARATLRQRMVEYDLGTDVDSLLTRHRAGQHVAVDLAVGEIRAAEAELRLSGTQADQLSLTRFDREKTDAELARLDAQIRSTEQRLQRLEVASPARGVILTEQVERLPGSGVRAGDLLLEVANVGDWRVTLMVNEADVSKIRIGDRVQVEVQAFDASERDLLGGKVTYVSPEPTEGATTPAAGSKGTIVRPGGTYRVVATLDPDELERVGVNRFRRGYTVQGYVITRSGKIITLLWNYLSDKIEKRS